MIGKTISHYKITEKLGEGGMGEVYLADDLKLERQVAIKFLPEHLTKDKENVERFEREAKAAAALNHPNIITIYEIAKEDDQTFIVMEYVDGDSLRTKIDEKNLAFEEVINITNQICEGLTKAHQADIVHRDIKPENILIDNDGRVKILDFGLAKLKGVSKLTKEASTLGTIHYMSPEQIQGKEVDQRSDIWSFGVVLYEMLTGEVPFSGDYEQAVSYAILNEDFEPMKTEDAKGLKQIISKCLQKNPTDRYQNVQELIQELKQTQFKKEDNQEQKPSIAVLPFANMSADPEQEYFCDGMTEEIINTLSHVDNLKVIARTSAFMFKDKHEDMRSIGNKLSVGHLLEGSIRKAGNRLRITAQLINVADGSHLWSEKFDREIEDIFAIQDEISLAIVDKLKIKLLGDEKAISVKRYTENLDVYNLYLKGRFYCNRRTEEGFRMSLGYFQKAIKKDPTYALAYVGIADCYYLLGWYDYIQPKEVFPKAKKAVYKALELDDALGEAHTTMANLKANYDRDWVAAKSGYQRAIELNPDYAPAHQWHARYLSAKGIHNESIEVARRALELDPLSLIMHSVVGLTSYEARNYDTAIEAYKKAIELDPNFFVTHFLLAFPFLQKEMYDEAISEVKKAIDVSDGKNPLMMAYLGAIYSHSGKRDEAKQILYKLKNISKHRYISPYFTALIYIGFGQNDQAFKWLEKAYDDRDHWLEGLKVEPMLDRLRSDPRFIELLKKMGLEK